MSTQHQYVSTVEQAHQYRVGHAPQYWIEQAQQYWVGMIGASTRSVRATFGMPDFVHTDPDRVIDLIFDYWAKTVEVQRESAKTLTAASIDVHKHIWQAQARMAQRLVEGPAQNLGELARRETEFAEDQFAAQYEDQPRTELQAELTRRTLATTGTVEELRARLVQDDLTAA